MSIIQKLWKKEEVTQEVSVITQTDKQGVRSSDKVATSQPFYKHPKILLIDIKDDSEKILKAARFNVESGSFGTPYKVEQAAGYIPVAVDVELPNYEEQEIVVIDLHPKKTSEKIPTTNIMEGNNGFYGKCNYGVIDPRPIAALSARSAFDKILSRNGVFIIFANSPSITEIVLASNNSSYGFNIHEDKFSIWSFLTPLNIGNFQTKSTNGSELTVEIQNASLERLMKRYLDKTTFTCTLFPTENINHRREVISYSNRSLESWFVIAKNRGSIKSCGNRKMIKK